MKNTMKKYLSMAVLALAGAMMSGCGNEDDFANDSKQQPANVNNVVTLTTTVGLGEGATNRAMGEGATNRALAAGGVKTFAKDEQMAIVYKNTSGQTVKAVSAALTDGDITTTDDEATNKKSATFTFTLTDPDREVPVRYIYPAAMANETIATDATIDDAGTVDYSKLDTQDGTLTTLSSTLDLATGGGAWADGKLPGGTLQNRLAILACTIKKHAGDDITSSITSMTVSDGTNSYTVNREEAVEAGTADGPIYVAIRPTTGATINVTATNGAKYVKTLTAKTYEASNGYPVSWKMDPLPVLNIGEVGGSGYTVTEDMVITGSSGGFAIYTDGSHEITLDNVTGDIHLNHSSSMTIKLKGENRLTSIYCGGDVTIADAGGGDGTLIVIDAGTPLLGDFIIEGGTVKAKATNMGPALNGDLTVNGGAVYLAGGDGNPAVDRTLTVNGGAVYLAGGNGAPAVGDVADGNATVYGWHENYGWKSKEDWMGQGLGNFNLNQYITTDDSSAPPTDPGNSKWNW